MSPEKRQGRIVSVPAGPARALRHEASRRSNALKAILFLGCLHSDLVKSLTVVMVYSVEGHCTAVPSQVLVDVANVVVGVDVMSRWSSRAFNNSNNGQSSY